MGNRNQHGGCGPRGWDPLFGEGGPTRVAEFRRSRCVYELVNMQRWPGFNGKVPNVVQISPHLAGYILPLLRDQDQ
jgi:hypothetical protein